MEVINELEQEQQLPDLPLELVKEQIKVIEVPAYTFGTRKVFENLKPEHTNFTFGIRVLPATFVGIPDQGAVYFRKKHEPNTPYWKDGGYECFDISGGIRSFFLDALMIHPSEMKRSERVEVEGLRKKGRKTDPNKPKKDPNVPKGKRGRKPLSDEEKLKRQTLKILKNPNLTGKKGRPKMDPLLRKTKPFISTGRKRGRPSKPINFEL